MLIRACIETNCIGRQVLCEVPSNMILSKFDRPSWYMGTIVTCWGIVMTLSGVVKSFAGLCVTRALIGFFEVCVQSS